MLRLGVLGLSDGNGHPYSWSAIFNGYDADAMEQCGFPVIPRYLEQQAWPDAALRDAKVTHVWTQDSALSEHVAQAARIGTVVTNPAEMIGAVDAILLARDDAENHLVMAASFLEAGLPIYIDKPVTLSMAELEQLYNLQKFPGQIFTCSALRYATELSPSAADLAPLGRLRHVQATCPKDWDKYAVHLIEPLLNIIGDQGELTAHHACHSGDSTVLQAVWSSGIQASIATLGKSAAPFTLRLIGEKGSRDLFFSNTFQAFKAALSDFVQGALQRDVRSDPAFVRKVVQLIEAGRTA